MRCTIARYFSWLNARQPLRTTAALLVGASVVVFATADVGIAERLCDVDNSGTVTVTDGVLVLRAAAGLPGPCSLASCDVDANGTISVTDGVVTLRAAAGLAGPCPSSAPATELVSKSTGGAAGDSSSQEPAISADGRFVAFASSARNFVLLGGDRVSNVFVRDRIAGTTDVVSVDSDGHESDGDSGHASISDDGRFVAFASNASNLVLNDAPSASDVFVHDRLTGMTELISVNVAGGPGNGNSTFPTISADGRYVAFTSESSGLAFSDQHSFPAIYVRDRQSQMTVRVSSDATPIASTGLRGAPVISRDGRYVAYASFGMLGDPSFADVVVIYDMETGARECVSTRAFGASLTFSISPTGRWVAFTTFVALIASDVNSDTDVYLFDRETGDFELVSLDSNGRQANSFSVLPSISADGRFVAFVSDANNLVDDDHNGASDVFVRDRTLGRTWRGDVANDGAEAATGAGSPAVADGGLVAFDSFATNLASDDGEFTIDVFVRTP